LKDKNEHLQLRGEERGRHHFLLAFVSFTLAHVQTKCGQAHRKREEVDGRKEKAPHAPWAQTSAFPVTISVTLSMSGLLGKLYPEV
jgi:hypothetical protein